MASPAFLVFKFPRGGGGGGGAPTTLQEKIHGEILDPIIILMQNTLLFVIYDSVIRLVLFVFCEQNYLSHPLFLLY